MPWPPFKPPSLNRFWATAPRSRNRSGQLSQSKLSPYESWAAAKAGASVEKLGYARLQEILASPAQQAIHKLIDADKALEPQATAIASVDKLLRLHRDLFRLLNNFVAFRDFYGRQRKAVFQAGTLFLDRRSCDLCLRVDNPAKQGAPRRPRRAYLPLRSTRQGPPDKMTIAAAFTNGDSDNLMVGRNGVFYDRQGRDWDATITKIVEQPISIREAFWSPYKKFIRLIESQAEKLASAREKAVQDSAAAQVAGAAAPARSRQTGLTKKEAFDVAKFAGIFAAIGLALGAIGGALAGLLGAFGKLVWWQMPLAVLGILLLISGPSMILAWMKLRQRNLGPILDANGWAVNARAKINLPFGASLTGIAKLPPNSERDLSDPFAEKKSGRNWLITLLIVRRRDWWVMVPRAAEPISSYAPQVSLSEKAGTNHLQHDQHDAYRGRRRTGGPGRGSRRFGSHHENHSLPGRHLARSRAPVSRPIEFRSRPHRRADPGARDRGWP